MHLPRRLWLPLVLGASLLLVVGLTMLLTRSAPSTPGDIINLDNWKLTLPVDTPRDGEPDEVKQPELRSYQSEFLRLNPEKTGAVFRATAGGVPTDGASFSRSELREMINHGTNQAEWSSKGSTHTMVIHEAITHLPSGRPAIVAGQIHGGDQYVLLIRLEGNRLFVKADGKSKGDLDTNYRLGTPFTVKIVSRDDTIRVYYNNALKVELKQACETCYFKAGAYLQSNREWDHPTAYGEVTVFDLQVTHSDQP